MEDSLPLPTDIPLIITSSTSTPETSRKRPSVSARRSQKGPKVARKESVDGRQANSDNTSHLTTAGDTLSQNRKHSCDGKNRTVVGGSLKYEIGRNRSVTNLINLKWSSVRIKGTGYDESRKSVVKIEPCNGISGMGLGKMQDYVNLKSPTDANVKNNIGNVSYVCVLV